MVGRRLPDHFRDSARRCRSIASLRSLLEDAARELGFDFFALLHHASLGPRTDGMVRIDNYPDDWADEFLTRGFESSDPVHHACRRTHDAFQWAKIGKIIQLAPKQRLILKRSRKFGIGTGFTIPVNIPGEPSGSCSFAVRRGTELPEAALMNAQLIGTYAFDAARRLNRLSGVKKPPRLSRRQIECLYLLSAGKTDWEIAVILGISVETARQYVKSARAAYNAVNRTHLAVLALRDDILRFEDLPIR
jgi:LuxR family quorum-sensing system transcriptional regulator CciR